MPTVPAITESRPTRRIVTIGAVSFLNSRPLLEGLIDVPGVRVRTAVPAALPGALARGEVDVAQLPIVDVWRGGQSLTIVSDACIASEAETLTVRVFSRVPPDRVTRLVADPDSHTSVVLAQVLWRELYGRQLVLRPPGPEADGADAVLLIGDKVVTDAPRGFGFEVDLGGAWRHLTGLPFVFAIWAGAADRDWSELAAALSHCRDRGVSRAAEIAESAGPEHGWPVPLARRYLCQTLRYTLTPDMRSGMARFFDLATRHRLLPR